MLSVNAISFSYTDKPVLKDISFSLKKGTCFAIMGESGCGKSTLLKALYGLLSLSEGKIYYQKKELLGPEHHLVPGHPFMKYLAQNLDLMPYTSAAQNVGDFLSNFYPQKKQKRIKELLEVVGMTKHAATHVRFLSGGQKQRVALARVLAKKPEILLLDEPFSQIDNFKKNELRYSLFEFLKKENITCITATHDKDDVLPFADQVLILKNGIQLQIDAPKKIYNRPKDVYTASLFSEVNLIDAKLFLPEIEGQEILIYPHEIKLFDKSPVKCLIIKTFYKGNHFIIHAQLKNYTIVFQHNKDLKPQTTVGIKVTKNIVRKRLLFLSKI